MHKRKAGLQKEVSKIFTGIQIPKKDASQTNPRPAASAPAPAVPKLTPAIPRPFVIPEPEQHTHRPVSPAPVQKVYEPPVPVQKIPEMPVPALVPVQKVEESPAPAPKVYEPPQSQRNVYEPPMPAPLPVRQPRIELPPKRLVRIPRLKIWEELKSKLLTPKPGVSPGRQKAMVLMAPALLVVFVIVLFQVLRAPARPAVNSANKASQGGTAAFAGNIDWEMPPPYPENLRDAMVFGATTQKENAGRPVVKGIVYSDDNPCAVVGERIVSAGDVVGGATVVKINQDSVEFAKGDEKWTQKVER